jgi:MoaA/NifB/PqqE/SkfB family radical SAM enzyme
LKILNNRDIQLDVLRDDIQPFEVEIDPTNICNQNCYFCNVEEFRKTCKDAATTEDYMQLINSLPDTVGKIVFSGGGDPIVHPNISDMIREACKKRVEVGLITNGTLLQRLNVTKDLHPTWIGIDVDTVDSDAYFTIRESKIDYVMKNIDNVVPQIQSCDTIVTFKALITHYNNTWEKLEEAIKFASDKGFDEFFIRIAHFKDGRIIEPITTWDDVEKRLRAYAEKVGIKFMCAFEKEKIFRKNKGCIEKCFGPKKAVIFCADGYTYWCTEFRGVPEYRLGSWIKDGYNSIFKKGLPNEMEQFNKYHKCDIQCKYSHLVNEDGSWDMSKNV